RQRRQGQSAGRVPPNNVQAEESLLGAMLLSRSAIDAGAEAGIDAADFYKPAHGHVFAAVMALYAQGEPSDPVTVAEALRRDGQLEAIGGPATLTTLMAGTPSTGNAGRYARIVKDHAQLRELIRAAGDIAEMGYELPEDVAGAIDAAEQMVFDLRPRADVPTAHQLRDVLGEWLDQMEALVDAGGQIIHPTGWTDLDHMVGGLHPARLVIVAARPGMGKTSWAGALTLNVARRGEPVLFVSVEMSREELAGRMVASSAGLVGSKLSQGDVVAKDWDRISGALTALSELSIDIVDTTPATLLSVRTAIRRSVARYGRLGLVVVDYVQLMTGRSRAENRQVEVAEIVRGLKLMSKEMAVPIVALAQLSRNLEARMDKRPMLADLRESGELENSADQVVFIYRDEMYNPKTEDRGIAELIVAKNRHGAMGTVKVAADLASGRWLNLARVGS
ncbi:MAG TPA: replicative DNA helicase, partial [Acidimicrobiales bacterium]|nr:replicative DNA helicase [Acidimicrobiales bacterium]